MPRLCTPSPTTSRKIDYWLDGGVGTEMSYRTASTPDRLIAAVVGQSIAEQGVGNGSFARAYVICAVFLPPYPSPPSLPLPSGSPLFFPPSCLSSLPLADTGGSSSLSSRGCRGGDAAGQLVRFPGCRGGRVGSVELCVGVGLLSLVCYT